jgi:UDP-N-acetylglucosamine 1-carboxyvinyltransferase
VSNEKFVIEGGRKLSGTLTPSGSKNEALPALAATLLASEPVTLRNVPRIADIEVMIEVLRKLGVEVTELDRHSFLFDPRSLNTSALDPELCRRIRASILFAGPLVAKTGQAELPPPGGDVIGRRRLDTHFQALAALGAKFDLGQSFHIRTDGRLKGAEIFLDEASVTATENAIMAAVLADGLTEIENAACEPHVQGLCHLLTQMGAQISGIGTHHLKIQGVERLGGADYRIGSDYLEIGSFIGLAAITGGELTINDVNPRDVRMIQLVYRKLGVEFEVREGNTVYVPPGQELRVQTELLGQIPQIADAPWPQFPTDLMSIGIVVATQCKGTCIFFEKMFEGRMFFVDHLINMGAQIILCDPHRVVVVGPSRLFGTRLESPDVRAGMAMLIAALVAEGTSEIHNIRQIDRGYERVEEKLRALGAGIERVAVG